MSDRRFYATLALGAVVGAVAGAVAHGPVLAGVLASLYLIPLFVDRWVFRP